jgi:hypothetical protein
MTFYRIILIVIFILQFGTNRDMLQGHTLYIEFSFTYNFGRRERWTTTGVCEDNDELLNNTVQLNT